MQAIVERAFPSPVLPGAHPGRLHGRIALVTGADQDLGAAIAAALVHEGAEVVDLQLEDDDIAAARARGAAAVWMPRSLHGDQIDAAFCSRAIDFAVGEYGHLDILVNAHVDWTTHPDALPLIGLTLAALPWLAPGAAIVHAISGDGSMWRSASGAAMIAAFTRSLSRELTGRGIRVNAMATAPIWSSYLSAGSAQLIPVRGGDPHAVAAHDRLARCAIFLASDESVYMSGRVLEV